MQANEQTDEQVAQYSNRYSWLFWPTVHQDFWFRRPMTFPPLTCSPSLPSDELREERLPATLPPPSNSKGKISSGGAVQKGERESCGYIVKTKMIGIDILIATTLCQREDNQCALLWISPGTKGSDAFIPGIVSLNSRDSASP